MASQRQGAELLGVGYLHGSFEATLQDSVEHLLLHAIFTQVSLQDHPISYSGSVRAAEEFHESARRHRHLTLEDHVGVISE